MNTLFPDFIPTTAPALEGPRHTLFFGLLPPTDLARRVHDLADRLRRSGKASGKLRPEGVLHVSLALVGKELAEPPPAGLIVTLRARAATVRQRPFTVCLNRVESWGRAGGHVVAVGEDGVIGVDMLHERLAEALGSARRAQFTPHMTLLYGSGPLTPLPIPPIAWTVQDFALIHSFVGCTRYEVLSRFPLPVEPAA